MKNFWKKGDPFIWLTGGALGFSLMMIGGLVFLIMFKGLGFFWPAMVLQLTLKDGKRLMGQVMEREEIPQSPSHFRLLLKVGNRDLYGQDFKWVEEAQIHERTYPENVFTFERLEWGNLYGFIAGLRQGNQTVSSKLLKPLLKEAQQLYQRIKIIEKKEIGDINYNLEKMRLKLRRLKLKSSTGGSDIKTQIQRLNQHILGEKRQYNQKEEELKLLYPKFDKYESFFRP